MARNDRSFRLDHFCDSRVSPPIFVPLNEIWEQVFFGEQNVRFQLEWRSFWRIGRLYRMHVPHLRAGVQNFCCILSFCPSSSDFLFSWQSPLFFFPSFQTSDLFHLLQTPTMFLISSATFYNISILTADSFSALFSSFLLKSPVGFRHFFFFMI